MTEALANHLQIWGVEDGVMIFTDGSAGMAINLSQFDISCWDDASIQGLDEKIKTLLNLLPTNLDCQFVQDINAGNSEQIKKFSNQAQFKPGSDEIVELITKERANYFFQLDNQRLLPRFKNYFLFRRKMNLGPMKKLNLLSRDKTFPTITKKTLDTEIERTKNLANELRRSFNQAGIDGQILAEDELLSLVYFQWNPDRNVDIGAYDPSDIRPYLLFSDCHPDHTGFTIGGYFHRLISLKLLPGQSYSSMAEILKELPFSSRVLLTIKSPEQIKEMESLQLQRRLAFSLVHGKQSGVSDLESEAKLNDLEQLLEEMISSGEKVFHFSLNIVLKSNNISDLDEQVSQTLMKVRELGGAEAMQESLAAFDIFKDISIPNSRSKERVHRIKTSNLSHFIPIYAPWKGHLDPRILLRSRMGTLISFDPFSPTLTNANQIISGGSGSGKSFLTNLLLLQMLKNDPIIYLIDIGGSYKKVVENLNGQYIKLGLNSGLSLNPFDLAPSETKPSADKIKFLVTLVESMAKEEGQKSLRKLERTQLEEAVEKSYQAGPDVTLSNLKNILLSHENEELRRIGKILNTWSGKTAYGEFLDRKTRISLERPLICFDLKDLESYPDLQAVCLLIITDLVNRAVQADKTRMKFLVFDECWKLLEDESGAQFIASVFRTFRKYYASCIAISQNIDDFAKSKVASAVMPNSSIKWVLKQKGSDKERLKSVLELNEREVELITSLGQERGYYSEALLICEDVKSVVSIESTPLEYWLATTDPRDLSFIENEKFNNPQLSFLNLLQQISKSHPHGFSGGEQT